MYLLNSDGISIAYSSLLCRTTFIVAIIEKEKLSNLKESLFYVTYFPLQFVEHFRDAGEHSKHQQYVFFDRYII